MKKFIFRIFGIESTAKQIMGRKSNGVEDERGYQHWRKNFYGTPDSLM